VCPPVEHPCRNGGRNYYGHSLRQGAPAGSGRGNASAGLPALRELRGRSRKTPRRLLSRESLRDGAPGSQGRICRPSRRNSLDDGLPWRLGRRPADKRSGMAFWARVWGRGRWWAFSFLPNLRDSSCGRFVGADLWLRHSWASRPRGSCRLSN